MNDLRTRLTAILTSFFGPDKRRIKHALNVLREAERLASNRTDIDMDILVAAAILHDVGIKPSEEKYGFNTGKTQEKLGPPVAGELLRESGLSDDKTRKIKEIIGNHHSRSRYDYPELEVLKEADNIVNRAGK